MAPQSLVRLLAGYQFRRVISTLARCCSSNGDALKLMRRIVAFIEILRSGGIEIRGAVDFNTISQTHAENETLIA
jgi:hypothetical protein